MLTVLREIEQLTLEQRVLIGSDDKAALERNLAEKESLIRSLAEASVSGLCDEARALLERIEKAEKLNIQAAQDELETLRGMMKKAHEGMTTVRGYDTLSSGVGATYIDKKQ
jgi:hypothetical protein